MYIHRFCMSSELIDSFCTSTGWRRLIGSPKLQIIFHKRATKYRSLLRKMTYKDKGSYESLPPCTYISCCTYIHQFRSSELVCVEWTHIYIYIYILYIDLACQVNSFCVYIYCVCQAHDSFTCAPWLISFFAGHACRNLFIHTKVKSYEYQVNSCTCISCELVYVHTYMYINIYFVNIMTHFFLCRSRLSKCIYIHKSEVICVSSEHVRIYFVCNHDLFLSLQVTFARQVGSHEASRIISHEPVNGSCFVWTSHVPYEWVMSHMNDSCPTWISHDCPPKTAATKWVGFSLTNRQMSHVPYERDMSHMNQSSLPAESGIHKASRI